MVRGARFATLVLMRRSYGGSEGEWVESYGPCADPQYDELGHTTAQDIDAGVRFMRARPDVDANRIVLVGHSAGAHGALALASGRPPGVVGVINFAGGRGGSPTGHCASDRLVATFGRWARTTAAPTLWVYAVNDEIFATPLVRRLHAAWEQAGGQAELVLLPAAPRGGHNVFTRPGTSPDWGPPVERFLARLGLAAAR